MKRTLDQFYLLPVNVKIALEKENVKTINHLLDKAAWTHDRQQLLNKTHINEDDLRPWVITADICRIKGILPRQAQEIAMSGLVSSAKEIAKLTDEQLRVWFNSETGYANDFSVQVRHSAGRLTPRLIWDDQDVGNYEEITFGYIANNIAKQDRIILSFDLFLVGLFLFSVFYGVFVLGDIVRELSDYGILAPILLALFIPRQVLFILAGLSLLFFACLWLFGFTLLASRLFSASSMWIKPRIKNNAYRKIELHTNLDQAPLYKASWIIVSLFLATSAVLLGIVLSTSSMISVEDILRFAPLFIVIIITSMTLIDTKLLVSKIAELNNKRYYSALPILFSVRLFQILLIPAVLVLAYFTLTVFGTAHDVLVGRPLGDVYIHWIDMLRPVSDVVVQAAGDTSINLNMAFDYERDAALELFTIVPSITTDFDLKAVFLQMTMWGTIITAFLGAFIPQLILKERKKILLIIGTTLGAFLLERLLGQAVLGLLNLPNNAFLAGAVVLVNVFLAGNAADLVEDVSETTGLIVCSNCGENLNPDAKFCSSCGTPVIKKELK